MHSDGSDGSGATRAVMPEVVVQVRDDVADWCFICMDEQERGSGDRLMSNVCKCKTTLIHRSCLEKLANSKRRRPLSLDERLECPTCKSPWRVPIMATFIKAEVSPYRRSSSMKVVFGLGFVVVCLMFGRRLPPVFTNVVKMSIFAVGLVMMFVAAIVLFVAYRLECRWRAQLPPDPEKLDDDRYHDLITCNHRAHLNAYKLTAPALEKAMCSQERWRVVLLVDAAESYPGDIRASVRATVAAGTSPVAASTSEIRTLSVAASTGVPDAPGGPALESQRYAVAVREPVRTSSVTERAALVDGGSDLEAGTHRAGGGVDAPGSPSTVHSLVTSQTRGEAAGSGEVTLLSQFVSKSRTRN
mmetsp:Transcript_41161/g.95347  ORF Transcript_41161/g.95347 Transcript_41161/m.95347 type:complete len:358 (+) Transcript_41161:34-1107(+)